MARNEAIIAAQGIRRGWRVGRLVLGGYTVVATTLMCLSASMDPLHHGVLKVAIVVIVVSPLPWALVQRYQRAKGRALTRAIGDMATLSALDLSSPQAYVDTRALVTLPAEPEAIAAYQAARARRAVTHLHRFPFVYLLLAGTALALTMQILLVDHEATGTATAVVTQCSSDTHGSSCDGTWTIDGTVYSGVVWHGTSSPPAAGSTETVRYVPSDPTVDGGQDWCLPITALDFLTLVAAIPAWAVNARLFAPYRDAVITIASADAGQRLRWSMASFVLTLRPRS